MSRKNRQRRMRLQRETPPPEGSGFRAPAAPAPSTVRSFGRMWGSPWPLTMTAIVMSGPFRIIIEVSPFRWGLMASHGPAAAGVRVGCVLVVYSRIPIAALPNGR